MSVSTPITIGSEELRQRVEDHLGRWITDPVWTESEAYARKKIAYYREMYPGETYYTDDYLVLLTADTVRETEFSRWTAAECERKMAAQKALKTFERSITQ